ncbi:MAG: beta-lactamase family protein [Coriobacteriales bacterium]|nr:beta-lactamase family protein [Coriobacteriales bacterium]
MTVDESDFKRMVNRARAVFATPSIAAALCVGSETYYHVRGHTRVLGGKANEQTVYPIASASKAFIATCVMMLVEEGLLNLDTPVKRYMSDLELFTPQLTEQLTPRDMLSHFSGLPRHDATLQLRATATLQEMVCALRWLEPAWGLRERFCYQNHMFAVASLLVERICGKPWGEVVRERVFEPLGMTRSYTSSKDYRQADSNYAHPLVTRARVSVPIYSSPTEATACAGALSMSIGDLLRWGRANLVASQNACQPTGQPPLISPASARELHKAQTPIRSGEMTPYNTPFVETDAYGLGWFVETYRGAPLIHHGGTINGFKSVVGFLPGHDCAFAVLVNQNGSAAPAALMRGFADAVIGAGSVDSASEGERHGQAYEAYDWCDFYRKLVRKQRAKAEHDYHTAFAQKSQKLPAQCEGSYRHPAYGELRVANTPRGPRLLAGNQGFRLRPGVQTPWVIDTGVLRLAVPCYFESGSFNAFLEPELKKPICFVGAATSPSASSVPKDTTP